MVFVEVGYSFRSGFNTGVENFYFEKGLAESASPETICLDVKSRVIFGRGYFILKAFAFQR